MTQTVGLRTCRACRIKKEKKTLLRLTMPGEDTLEADPLQTEPGRGWYLCREEKCLRCLTTVKGRRQAFGRDLGIGPKLQKILLNTPGGVHGREDESI